MSPHDDTGNKLPDEKICELVFEAGYNGMAIDLGASDVKKAFELQPIMENWTPKTLLMQLGHGVHNYYQRLV